MIRCLSHRSSECAIGADSRFTSEHCEAVLKKTIFVIERENGVRRHFQPVFARDLPARAECPAVAQGAIERERRQAHALRV
jgi:hypothetical protein